MLHVPSGMVRVGSTDHGSSRSMTPTSAHHQLHENRRKLLVRGRQGVHLFVVVTVYRDSVWLTIDPPFASDIAILDPPHIDQLIEILRWAAKST